MIGWSQHQDTTSESELVMSPSIPGVDRDVLIAAIHGVLPEGHDSDDCWDAADAALAHIAAHHECACDREHDDEWVEVGGSVVSNLPNGARARVQHDWVVGYEAAPTTPCYLVHRDDLPDPDADLVERMARAIFASYLPDGYWGNWGEDVPEHYRTASRAALAAYREEER